MSNLQAQVNIEQPVEVPREPDVSSNMEVLRINNESEASKPPVATQATAARETHKNLLNSLFKFKAGEPLGKYIATKAEKKDVYTLTEVLSILKETIRHESMFDEFNPSIILCDSNLEEALGMKALHVTEIRDLVLKQLEKLSDPPTYFLTTSPTLSLTPNPHAQSQSQVLGRSMSISSVSAPSSQPSIPPTSQRVSQPSALPFSSQVSLPPSSVQSVSAQATLAARQLSCTPRPNVISSSVYNNPSARFCLKPDFLPVIRSIAGVDPNQTLFSYEQVTLLLSKYILAKKHTMFDQRNIKVALVANDPLGKAFNVKAFHRCQVTNLLRSQLIHVEEPCNSAVSSTTGEPENPKGTSGTVQVPPFPVLQKSQSMPGPVAYAVNQLAEASRLTPSTSAGVVRKRSLTPEAPEQVAKRSRDSGPAQYAVVVRKANDSDSETETICSAQGYETAAADRDETILVERVESTENGNDGGCSTSDTEMEDDKSDHFSRTALVYSVQYEEYEVESSSEDEKRPNIAGGGADSDSENNSDIEDDHKVAAGVVAVMAALGSDSDYLGDSEEEDVTPGEKELDVVDPELEERDNWRCAQCDTPNTPLIRYCGKCWKIRKGWMPDRPKPRKKVRQAAWGNRGGKKNLPALDRSLSDPGQGQDEADSVLASEVTAVSDDEKNKDGVTDSQSTDSGISCAGSQELLSQDLEVGSSQDQYSESGSSVSNKCDDAMSVSSQDLGSEVSLLGEHGSKKEQNLCMFCNVRPKNASFIHGRLGHQVCCYQCARKCYNKHGRCPICRRKIEKIIRNLIQ